MTISFHITESYRTCLYKFSLASGPTGEAGQPNLLWRDVVDAGGTIVSLQTPMGIMETKAGWILLLGFTPESSGTQLEEDFLKMIKSAR